MLDNIKIKLTKMKLINTSLFEEVKISEEKIELVIKVTMKIKNEIKNI